MSFVYRFTLAALCLFSSALSFAQESPTSLIGKWQVTFAETAEKAVYEIKEIDGKLQGFVVSFIDAQGKLTPNPDNTLVLTDFKSAGDSITANYQVTYEEQIYEVETTLKNTSDSHVENNYVYYGYAGKESWSKSQ